ncbi:MAG: hypothetical protein DRJ05_01650 [Bacteroidetes bacterium]|nr:MAG: hypothetical protein DRJ05_01650 [Bacteroidota bacterium]
MKKPLLFIAIFTMSITLSFSQVFDSLTVIHPDYNIQDIARKGDVLYAALAEGGVMYSSDEGFTWTATADLPDAGFGDEAAYTILTASNGDLIVGGNTNYSGNPLGGAVFRSSNNGTSWSAIAVEGYAGYEKSEKIVELPNGNLMMQAGQSKLFVSSLSSNEWTQCTSPGGVILGFEAIGDMVFTVTNPAGGNAGTWVTSDLGQSWQRYGSNGSPIGSGTVTIAPVIKSGDYKYIGIGGYYDPKGIYRSGINDTLWVEVNNGLNSSGIYPICMATDNQTIWMVFQDAGGGCSFTSTSDFGDNWAEPIQGGLPQQGVGGPCVPKMMVFKTHLYTFANKSIYRIEDVAIPASTGEIEYKDNYVDVFPNPVSDQLNIKIKKTGILNGKWEIINIYGQVMMSGELITNSNNSISVEVSQLTPGYYLLKTDTEDKISVTNFLKN